MGGEGEGHLVPPDVDVGVVIGLLGSHRDTGHETHRLTEVLEGEQSGDLLAGPRPVRVRFEESVDLVVCDECHAARLRPSADTLSDLMAIRHDQAIVLRSYPFGEADRVVVLLSPNNGKIRTVAKGVRKTKSRFGGRLEPFTHVDLILYEGRNLDTITQVAVLEHYPRLRADLDAVIAAGTMVEAADAVAQQEESSIRLFLLLQRGLKALEAGERGHDLITSFLLKLAAVVGVAPSLTQCAACGRSEDLHRFSFGGGGAICDLCRVEGVVRLRDGLTDYLAALADAELMALPSGDDDLSGEAMGIARRFVEYHLDRKLTSLAVME